MRFAERTAELLGPGLRIISCHLGGSSSLCAIRNGQSVATTMGMSAQSGLPQNNRVGDFDAFALPPVQKTYADLREKYGFRVLDYKIEGSRWVFDGA